MPLKFCTSVAKRLKLKIRKFWELIPALVEVTGEKLIGERGKKTLKEDIFSSYSDSIEARSIVFQSLARP